MVHHLELRLLGCPIFLPRCVYLDPVEEHLLAPAKAYLLEGVGHYGYGDQVQAESLDIASLERNRHLYVPRTSIGNRPRPEAALPPGSI